MSRRRRRTAPVRRRFPRVSGDEPVISPVVLEALVFSPRERG